MNPRLGDDGVTSSWTIARIASLLSIWIRRACGG